jgi:hypothetical protein
MIGFSGSRFRRIGGFRDIGNPNDARRALGPRPMGPAAPGMPGFAEAQQLFPRQSVAPVAADPLGLAGLTGPAYQSAPAGVRPQSGATFQITPDGRARLVSDAADGIYDTNYLLSAPQRPDYSPSPYAGQVVDTGQVLDPSLVQLGLPTLPMRGRDRLVGYVPRQDTGTSGTSRGSKTTLLPDLIAGRIQQAEFSPSEGYDGSVRYVLTQDDLLRGASTPEDVERRLRVWESFAAANPRNRVPRSAEQAEEPRPAGVLNWRTGLPDDRPTSRRGGSLARNLEDAALNADAGGTRSEDAAGTVTAARRSAEMAPFGTVPVVEMGPGGQFALKQYDPTRLVDNLPPDPGNDRPFVTDVTLGSAVQEILERNQTPVVRQTELARRGFTPLAEPQGTLIGSLTDGTLVFAPVDPRSGQPVTGASGEQLFRLGSPINRDDAAIRAELAPLLGGSFQFAPDTGTTIGAGGLTAGLKRGFTFSPGRANDMPLFNITTPEQAQAYVQAVAGQSTGHPLVTSLYAIDAEGRPVQMLRPTTTGAGDDSQATGQFNPVRRQWIGPAALVPGDADMTVNARLTGERWGVKPEQFGGGGLTRDDVSLSGLLGNLQKGSFMQEAGVAGNPLARMVASGAVSPALLDDPRLAQLFPPGSQARIRFNQDVIAAGGSAPFADGLMPTMPAQTAAGMTPFQEFTATPLPPRGAGTQIQGELNLTGESLQRAAAAALFGSPTETQTRPSGRRTPLPQAVPSEPAGDFIVDANGQMRIAAPIPGSYAPDPIDDVAAYMATQARQRPSAAPLQPGYTQPGLLPRIGEDVRITPFEVPVGRAAGPYAGASYYGLGDRAAYQQAATPRGALAGFDYRAMAEGAGAEVGSPAHERAMRQLAMRLRHRQQNQTLGPVDWRAAGAAGDVVSQPFLPGVF